LNPDTTETLSAGLQLYRQRLDMGYSLTDLHFHADNAP
jgi:hypothetical protein